MTREATTSEPVTYSIDGRKIKSAKDFYRQIGAAVNGPGGYFGRNLDALADCLRGGFGTPDGGRFEFVWQHSALSRQQLGGPVIAGSSVFESIQHVFRDAGVPLHLR